jgi:hypothetical protein
LEEELKDWVTQNKTKIGLGFGALGAALAYLGLTDLASVCAIVAAVLGAAGAVPSDKEARR